jgi:hypothetical protein
VVGAVFVLGVGTLVEVPVFVLSLVDPLKSPGSTKIAARTRSTIATTVIIVPVLL